MSRKIQEIIAVGRKHATIEYFAAANEVDLVIQKIITAKKFNDANNAEGCDWSAVGDMAKLKEDLDAIASYYCEE